MRTAYGTALVGAVAILLFLYEVESDRHLRAGRAFVVGKTLAAGRSGRTLTDVSHVVGGQKVRATLRAWYRRLRPGERVRVLYPPDDPENLVLAGFWQRHYGSAVALALFTALVVAEGVRLRAWRRRPAIPLLREELRDPRVAPGDFMSPPVDTSPRLWDRDLDG